MGERKVFDWQGAIADLIGRREALDRAIEALLKIHGTAELHRQFYALARRAERGGHALLATTRRPVDVCRRFGLGA